MTSTIILSIAIVLYLLAAGFALRLIRTTGKKLPWSLIGGALFLLAGQRAMLLFGTFSELYPIYPSLPQALVSLIIALLMVAGVALVAPLLQAYKRSDQLREVLSERTMIVQEHQKDQLRSLQQMQIAIEVGKPVNMIIGQVNALATSIQEFMEDMKSGLMVGKNFGLALQALIEEISQGPELPVQIDIDPKAAEVLTKDQGMQLLHIAREAVINSQRHAKAKKGRVTLKYVQKTVTLEILDNGQGFEVDLVKAQGNGLGNMVARARKIDARLKIKSTKKQGTCVHLEIPINHVPVES